MIINWTEPLGQSASFLWLGGYWEWCSRRNFNFVFYSFMPAPLAGWHFLCFLILRNSQCNNSVICAMRPFYWAKRKTSPSFTLHNISFLLVIKSYNAQNLVDCGWALWPTISGVVASLKGYNNPGGSNSAGIFLLYVVSNMDCFQVYEFRQLGL